METVKAKLSGILQQTVDFCQDYDIDYRIWKNCIILFPKRGFDTKLIVFPSGTFLAHDYTHCQIHSFDEVKEFLFLHK